MFIVQRCYGHEGIGGGITSQEVPERFATSGDAMAWCAKDHGGDLNWSSTREDFFEAPAGKGKVYEVFKDWS